SKVTDIPMVNLATRIMMGDTLKNMGYTSGLHTVKDYVAVKVPVFSFAKLQDVDTQLGPEMKSTGEVLGVAKTFEDAIYKGLVASGNKMECTGGVLLTVRDRDKEEIIDIGHRFNKMGFRIYATVGTALVLNEHNIPAKVVKRMAEKEPNIGNLLESGDVTYVISSTKGRQPEQDEVKMRRKAVETSITLLTSLDTARALLNCLESSKTMADIELVDINTI
ncbi:MAG: carbamoyl-phosphate synthase large subunit, partial [Eubacterium sp.]